MARTAPTGPLIALSLDRTCSTPLWRQLLGELREAIRSGRLAGGTRLPSTRSLAADLGLSRNTVLQVFDVLRDEGLLVSRTGAGTQVVSPAGAGRAPSAAPAEVAPARALSCRGEALVTAAAQEFGERPLPFMPDIPDLRAFPIRSWTRLLGEVSGRLTGRILVEAGAGGYAPLRRAIAGHLNAARGMDCTPEQVLVTSGSQQGLDLACRLLIDPGDPVWMEDPAYVGARSVIAGNGGAPRPLALDAEGMILPSDGAPPRLILVSPARHYPLGTPLSPERRRALLDLARRSGSWILEDDYDHEFARTNSAALAAADPARRTLHMGTFSKILLPSFRLGYLVVPQDLTPAFTKARAVVDRHASLIEQMVLAEFMERGLFAAHVRRMRALYRTRGARLAAGLGALFGAGPWSQPPSGTHIVLPFHVGADDRAMARDLAAAGVVVRPLSPYGAGTAPRAGLLLGFAGFDEAEMDRGLRRLEPLRTAIAERLERGA
ncbi:PLP-dependent aminotransferase family protein [Cereibacter sphaeroides]|uniref:MocR-like pyridoxine biosynthesis transcription factor PdxR n=1 Tax=Cereibacter sphaeroides TaxID=1063 RepID=UPI00313E4D0E